MNTFKIVICVGVLFGFYTYIVYAIGYSIGHHKGLEFMKDIYLNHIFKDINSKKEDKE